MMYCIYKINKAKFSPPIVTNSLLSTLAFEKKYIPKSKEYVIGYRIAGTLDKMEAVITI